MILRFWIINLEDRDYLGCPCLFPWDLSEHHTPVWWWPWCPCYLFHQANCFGPSFYARGEFDFKNLSVDALIVSSAICALRTYSSTNFSSPQSVSLTLDISVRQCESFGCWINCFPRGCWKIRSTMKAIWSTSLHHSKSIKFTHSTHSTPTFRNICQISQLKQLKCSTSWKEH